MIFPRSSSRSIRAFGLRAWAVFLVSLFGGEFAVTAAQPISDCPECPEVVAIRWPTNLADAVAGKSPTFDSKSRFIYVGRTEVTWRQYLSAMKEAGCEMPYRLSQVPMKITSTSKVADDFPVGGVSISHIDCYLLWLNKKTGKNYRLPSGLEWEYASGGGATSKFPWGDEIGINKAFIDKYFDRKVYPPMNGYSEEGRDVNLHLVGLLRANIFGLYDVIGNVWEFTSDTAPARGMLCAGNPEPCAAHVTKGGSYDDFLIPGLAGRHLLRDGLTSSDVGFRVVRN